MEQNNSAKSILDASILIATGSALIYFLSFVYDGARYKVYNIPTYLIEQSTSSIMSFASDFFLLGLLYAGLCIYVFFFLTNSLRFSIISTSAFLILYTIFKSAILFLLYFLFKVDLKFAGWYGIFSGIDVIAFLTWVLSKKQSLESPSESQIENKFRFHQPYFKIVVIMYLLLVLVGGSILSGNSAAKNETNYFVLPNNERLLVITKTNDNLICKPYNIKTNKVSDSVLIIKISDHEPIILKYKHIGKLKF